MRVLFAIFTLILTDVLYGQVGLVNNGAVLNIASGAAVYVDGGAYGNYYNRTKNTSNGKLILDGILSLEGDWFNNSSDSALIDVDTDGKVAFVNGGTQVIGGTHETKFENLEVANGTQISLARDTYIKSQLILSNGIVETNSDSLIIESTSCDAIIGQSETNFVNGNLRRYVATGTFEYPLEYNGEYLPAILEISSKGSMKFISAKFTPSDSESVPSGLKVNGTPIVDFLDVGYWTFTPDNGEGVEYDITLTSRGHSNGGAEAAQHAILKREDGASPWQSVGDHDNSTQTGSGTNAITAKRSNLTGFSDFIIGLSNETPLPISLVDFYGDCSIKGIRLFWETSTEYNNDYFTLYYSYDGLHFEPFDQVAGAGNSNIQENYSSEYPNYVSGILYFKLSQTDYDGVERELKTIALHCPAQESESIQCFGMSDGKIRLKFNSMGAERFSVCVFDALSRTIYKENILSYSGENTKDIMLNDFSSGMYIITLYNSTQRFSKKIILK